MDTKADDSDDEVKQVADDVEAADELATTEARKGQTTVLGYAS